MLKRAIRRLIVWTSVPPLDDAYRLVYRALIRSGAFLLSRRQRTLAVYVCRGCAKREIVPGLSDIDFIVIARGERDVPAIRRIFRTLALSSLRVIEYYPRLVMTRQTLELRWSATPIWQYRLQEGKTTWELLQGVDVVDALLPLSLAQERAAIYQEMTRWWLLFAKQVLGHARGANDPIVSNAICYKSVAELRNVRHALETGEYRYSRSLAFDGDDSLLARRLVRIAESRFLARDVSLADDTFRFLVSFFLETWRGFRHRPYLQVDARCSQAVDGAGVEWERDPSIAPRVRVIADHVERIWRHPRPSVHALRSAFWDFDDLLLIVDLDENDLPAVEEIASLVGLHRRLEQGASTRTFLFLRFGEVAFPLTPDLPRDLHRGIPTPATAPDVFLQIGVTPVYWTDYTRWYLADWRTNEQWETPSAEKERQLEAIARGAAAGAIVYPLSREALDRAALAR